MKSNFLKHIISKDGLYWAIYYVVDYTPLKKLLSDKAYLSLQYRCLCQKWIDWENPKSFNEKLQWLKVYDHNPEYTQMVDKYEAKKYVASIIGEEYIIPTLGVWDSIDDIDWDSLPNQFVLKCTHDSGGLVVCRDKFKFDRIAAIKKLKASLSRDFYYSSREWPYKNVKPRVIAEKYMEDNPSNPAVADLTDYKFFCFNGEPMYCQVIRDRHTKETIDFYDMEWNHMPFVGLNPVARNGLTPVARPKHLDEMAEICKKLSKDIPFSRIDLYIINDKEYFGEVTFYPYGGMGVFTPNDWNTRIGDLIHLKGEFRGGYNISVDNNIKIVKYVYPSPELTDYKFFCFNGEPKAIFIASDRLDPTVDTKFDFFDMDFNHLDFSGGHPNATKPILKPACFEQMKELARKLSKGIPHVRVDFYEVDGRVYFGELTFYHWGGMAPFEPEEWNYKFGEWIQFPKKR